ncbi:MAG: AAA domain-containing protein [Candidatus Omnitrophota bacterium]
MPHRKPKIRYALDEKEIIEQHFSRLNRLLQDEEREDRHRYRQEVLDLDPESRERKGRALLRLALVELHYNPSGQRLVTFGRADRRPIRREALQIGDVIHLAGFRTPPAERPTGTVYEKDRLTITVAFARELPGWVGNDKFYELSLAENQTTYDRMYEALRAVSQARHSSPAVLRDICLGLRKPRLLDPQDPGRRIFHFPQLNEAQKKAVCMALQAQDVMLIHGPPGTGKTQVLVEIVFQARAQGETVLVTAPSNAACDHLVECLVRAGIPVTRLGHPARTTAAIREHLLSYQMKRHSYAQLIEEHQARLDQIFRQKERREDRREFSYEEKKELAEEIRTLKQEIKNLRAEIFRQVWSGSEVVIATHTMCGDPILKDKAFQWVIVDEATQAIEPASWIPVTHAGRLILAGDHRQLPPTVLSKSQGPETLMFSLFERFHAVLGEESKIRLAEQYRMHEKIMNYSSEEFYEGKLSAAPQVRHHTLAGLPGVAATSETGEPVMFLDTAGLGYEEKWSDGSSSPFNPEEAKLAVVFFRKLCEAGVPARAIGLISPYAAQVRLLISLIYQDEWDIEKGEGPEIDSVDAFQGREKEAVLLSLVRSNLTGKLGFLADTRRMNVAMTRAKRKLIVIGDSATISTIPFYENFLRYVESIQAYRSAWELTG